MRYLAIDYGDKRTGLAVCDAHETLCSPLDVLATSGRLADQIAEIARDQNIGEIVVGLPLNMDGSEGPRVKIVKAFVNELQAVYPRPIHLFDERLSSFEAEQKFAGMGMTRKKKKKRLDAVAAAAILQAFLDNKGG